MCVEKCSDTKRTLRVSAATDRTPARFRCRPAAQRVSELPAGIVLADEADEDAARAESGDIARDIAGAADMDLAALGHDDRRRRFGEILDTSP